MLRNILVFIPAFAFALPFISSQTTSAAPLTTPTEEVDYCWGGCPGAKPGKPGKPHKTPTKPGKPGKGGHEASVELALEFCTQVQILAENRACEIKAGDECLAACDADTVDAFCSAAVGDTDACVDDTNRSCRAACVNDGAAFCDTRYKPGKKPGKKPSKPGKGGEHGGGGEGMIFVSLEQCFALGVDINLNK